MSHRPSTLRTFPWLLVTLEAVIYLSNDMYLPALPQMREELMLSTHLCELTVTVWLLGSCSLQWLMGAVTHRLGYPGMVLLGGSCFALSSFLCAISHDIHTLLLMRFFQGGSASALTVAGYACIHDHLPHEKAIATLAWMASVTVLAPALGPLLGGVVLWLYPKWRFIFFVLACLSMVITPWLYQATPRTTTEDPVSLRESFRHYFALWTHADFLKFSCSIGAIFAALLCWITTGSLLLHDLWHISSTLNFGIIQATVFLHFIGGSLLVKRCIYNQPTLWLIQVGTYILCASIPVLIYSATWGQHHAWLLVVTLSLIHWGAGMIFAPLSRLAIESRPEIPMPLRTASLSIIMGLGGVMGSLAPNAMSFWLDPYHAFIVCTLFYLLLGTTLLLTLSQTDTTITVKSTSKTG